MAGEDKRERTGRSDLFSVEGARSAIPTITEVPETPEEIRRKRVVRVTIATVSVIALALAVLIGVHLSHRASIDAARVEAERTGRVADIEEALRQLEGESGAGDSALAARLHAAAALEGVEGHVEPARSLLEGHDPTGDGASDHRIARTYLALAGGDPNEAASQAGSLVAAGPRAAEAARARALASLAIGNVEQALASARTATETLEGSPRHRALLALVSARGGQAPEAAGEETALRVARARIGWDAGGDRAALAREAEALASADDATPAERSWARLLGALVRVELGDASSASEQLTAVAEAAPPGDETFLVTVAEAWLSLRRRAEAEALLERLPSGGVSADAARRAQLSAELALERGDAGAAEAALAHAGEGPRSAFLRARLAVARGDTAAARPLFEEAARSPVLRLRASVALAEVLLGGGDAAGARTLLDPLVGEHPTHPHLAAAAGLAHAGAGDTARGLAIIAAALAEHEGNAGLLGARGRVHLRAEAWAPALEALRAAVQADPRDVSLLLDRGMAAQRAGETAEAAESYAAVVAIDAGNPTALPALLAAQLALDRIEPARETLAAIDTASLEGEEIDRLRARFLVASLAGEEGHAAVRAARRRHRRDRYLAYASAVLFMQAERWYDAIVSMNDALPPSDDTTPPEEPGSRRDVMILRVIAHARLGRGNMLERLMEPITDDAATTPLSARDEARLAAAQGFAELEANVVGRAAFWARRALSLDESSEEGLLLQAMVETRGGRDPTERLERALGDPPRSIEAMGMLALIGETLTPERCALAERYLLAAPRGSRAQAVRERVATLCSH